MTLRVVLVVIAYVNLEGTAVDEIVTLTQGYRALPVEIKPHRDDVRLGLAEDGLRAR